MNVEELKCRVLLNSQKQGKKMLTRVDILDMNEAREMNNPDLYGASIIFEKDKIDDEYFHDHIDRKVGRVIWWLDNHRKHVIENNKDKLIEFIKNDPSVVHENYADWELLGFADDIAICFEERPDDLKFNYYFQWRFS